MPWRVAILLFAHECCVEGVAYVVPRQKIINAPWCSNTTTRLSGRKNVSRGLGQAFGCQVELTRRDPRVNVTSCRTKLDGSHPGSIDSISRTSVLTMSQSVNTWMLVWMTLPAYERYMRPAYEFFVCMDKAPSCSLPSWVTLLVYEPVGTFSSEVAQCAAFIPTKTVFLLMDDWLPMEPVDRYFIRHAAGILTHQRQPVVHFVTIGSDCRLEFGGLASPWNGLYFAATSQLRPNLWLTSSLEQKTTNFGNHNTSYYWRRGILGRPVEFEWVDNQNRYATNLIAQTTSHHYPGLGPVPLSTGFYAFEYIHAVGNGKWRLTYELCKFFEEHAIGWELAARRNYTLKHATLSDFPTKPASSTARDSQYMCDNVVSKQHTSLDTCLCPQMQTVDKINVSQDALFVVTQSMPPNCDRSWNGQSNSIIILNKTQSDVRGMCCFNTFTMWRADSQRYHRLCVNGSGFRDA